MDVSEDMIESPVYTIKCTTQELNDIRGALKYADDSLCCTNSVYSDLLNCLKYSKMTEG